MDKQIEDFFETLDLLFSRIDKEEYEEFKRDLMEHIDVQLSEGIPIDTIIKNMGTPGDAADNFFQEKRLFTALNSESDIVPIEEVPDEFKKIKKQRRKSTWKKIKQTSLICLSGLFSILFIYFLVYITYSLLVDNYFSYMSFVSILSILTIYVCVYQRERIKKSYRYSLIIFCFLSGFILVTTNNVYYTGERLSDTLSLNSEQIDSINISSDFPIEIITVPVESSNNLTLKLDGFIKKTQSKIVSDSYHDGKIEINVNKRTLLDAFTKLPTIKLVVFVPQNSNYSQFTTNLSEGFIQVNNLNTDKLDISIRNGEVYLSQLTKSNINVASHMADINLNGFASDVSIKNDYGKNIIKNGSGDLTITGIDSLNNINDVNSNVTNIATERGKIILNNTSLTNLNINGKNSIIIAENQIGNTAIASSNGKIVLTNIGGRLELLNNEATVIVSQDGMIEGEIINKNGLVKWVQSENSKLSFKIDSPKEKITDTYSSGNIADSPFQIDNENGEVYIYPMIN